MPTVKLRCVNGLGASQNRLVTDEGGDDVCWLPTRVRRVWFDHRDRSPTSLSTIGRREHRRRASLVGASLTGRPTTSEPASRDARGRAILVVR